MTADTRAPEKKIAVTDDQIKHMIIRFLGWKLPSNFAPDAGITFKPDFNTHTDHPMRHEPSGTNLFGYEQAEAMVRYIVEGLPPASVFPDDFEERMRRADETTKAGIETLRADLTADTRAPADLGEVEAAIARLLRKAPASRAMADDYDDWGSVLTFDERETMRREAAEDEALAAHAREQSVEIASLKADAARMREALVALNARIHDDGKEGWLWPKWVFLLREFATKTVNTALTGGQP